MDKQKNGFLNKHILLLTGILLLTINCFAINPYKEKKSNEIIVTDADSVVRIHVPIKVKQIKTKLESVYYWYASNRIYCNKGGYSGKLLDGEYRVYGKDGNLLCYGKFDQGRKTGVWKYWNNAGILIKTEPWHHGMLCGKLNVYDSLGKTQKSTCFRKGLKQGKEKIYLTDTVLVRKYKADVLVKPKVKIIKEKKRKKESIIKDKKKTPQKLKEAPILKEKKLLKKEKENPKKVKQMRKVKNKKKPLKKNL